MGQVLILIGSFWLFAAVWLEYAQNDQWVWMAMLPFAWLGTLGLLRD